MLLRAIGAMLPAALAVALNPFPVIAIVLILGTEHARRTGTAFPLGWTAGLAAVTTGVLLLANCVDDIESTSAGIMDWVRIAVGLALIALAVRSGVAVRARATTPISRVG